MTPYCTTNLSYETTLLLLLLASFQFQLLVSYQIFIINLIYKLYSQQFLTIVLVTTPFPVSYQKYEASYQKCEASYQKREASYQKCEASYQLVTRFLFKSNYLIIVIVVSALYMTPCCKTNLSYETTLILLLLAVARLRWQVTYDRLVSQQGVIYSAETTMNIV